MSWGAFGLGLLSNAIDDRRASGGFGGSRGGLAGGSGYNPDVVRKGHRLDNRYYHQREALDWRKAVARGLTPQEYYGAGAPGNPGPSGGAAVLGNMAAQSMASGKAFKAQLLATSMQNETAIEQSHIAADAQRDVANIKAGQDQKGLDQRIVEYENIHLPAAQAKLKITREELKKVVNDVQTSEPAFRRMMALLQAGPENMKATMVLEKYGVRDPHDVNKLSPALREALLTEMIAVSAKLRPEIEGLINFLYDKFIGTPNPTKFGGENNRSEYKSKDDLGNKLHKNMNEWN